MLKAYVERLKGQRDTAPVWFRWRGDALVSFVLSTVALLILSFVHFWGFAERGLDGLYAIIPPFGASCALLFGATQVPAAQPRALVVGYFFGGVSGVVCQNIFRHAAINVVLRTQLGAAVALAFTVTLMKLTSTLHPPAGAVAILAAVLPPNRLVEDQGFLFLVAPLCIGAAELVLIAWLGNNVFAATRKHYPTIW